MVTRNHLKSSEIMDAQVGGHGQRKVKQNQIQHVRTSRNFSHDEVRHIFRDRACRSRSSGVHVNQIRQNHRTKKKALQRFEEDDHL